MKHAELSKQFIEMHESFSVKRVDVDNSSKPLISPFFPFRTPNTSLVDPLTPAEQAFISGFLVAFHIHKSTNETRMTRSQVQNQYRN